tara:strand:+ start:5292 stop:5783 length:492 start_codon:yes stop_codon:yes gene_type:complete
MSDEGDAGGGSFGKGSWRKAGYKDKIMEVQSAITSAAAGGSDVGVYYAIEIFVAMLGPHWDLTDEDIDSIASDRVANAVREFRDLRIIIEAEWDKPGGGPAGGKRPSPSRLFKMLRQCWKLYDDVIDPLVKKTPYSKSRMFSKGSEEETIEEIVDAQKAAVEP